MTNTGLLDYERIDEKIVRATVERIKVLLLKGEYYAGAFLLLVESISF
jgi:hypothetical protein